MHGVTTSKHSRAKAACIATHHHASLNGLYWGAPEAQEALLEVAVLPSTANPAMARAALPPTRAPSEKALFRLAGLPTSGMAGLQGGKPQGEAAAWVQLG